MDISKLRELVMDREAWHAVIHGVAKGWTWLSDWTELNVVICPKYLRRQWHPTSTLAWKIPWMEEPGRLQSLGLLRVRHDWTTSLSLFTFMHLEKETATHSSVLAWRIPGTGEPGGLPSMSSHRVGHDWSHLAAAAAPNTLFPPPSLLSLISPNIHSHLLENNR